jgi:hypothetical protein
VTYHKEAFMMRTDPRVPIRRSWHRLRTRAGTRVAQTFAGEAGMSTVEYAIGTLAAAAFAAVLYKVVSGDTVLGALNDLVQRALSVTF